jgi:CubicO group peptidase (beta-lactamase class C family)
MRTALLISVLFGWNNPTSNRAAAGAAPNFPSRNLLIIPDQMTLMPIIQRFCIAPVLCLVPFAAGAQIYFAEAQVEDVQTFLRTTFTDAHTGMVIGIVDEHGSRIFSAGKLDNDTDQDVDGDTIFEIGSVTKTFTALLALEMEQRGEIKLDDSVAKYLPVSVKMPAYGGKEITLLNLAAQDSGLPFNPDNYSGKNWKERFDSYTAEKMYAFLSGYTLTNEPGVQFQYSNLGMSLLGHVLELKAGTNFESLVLNRICRPLQMDSTCIKLTPELKARLATGHDEKGKRTASYDLQVMAGAGALLSSANDLLKYVSANLDLKESSLTPLMKKSQAIRHRAEPEFGNTAMPWWDSGVYQPPGMELIGHGGGTDGCSAFIGLDLKQRRGVVVLANQKVAVANSYTVGWRLLQNASLTAMDPKTMMPVREYVGTGIAFDMDKATGTLRIKRVYPNTSAAKAGLAAGLVVQKINDIPTQGRTLEECASIGRGPADGTVRMELFDTLRHKTNTVDLVRQKFCVSD